MPIYWGIIRRLGIKVNCYLVDSQTLRQLVGESGKTEWFPLWIGSLTPLGKKVSSPLKVCNSNLLLRCGLGV